MFCVWGRDVVKAANLDVQVQHFCWLGTSQILVLWTILELDVREALFW